MPKYYPYAICGYYLYYTSSCTIEAFHVHASNRKLSEKGSAKFFVYDNGDTKVEKAGRLKGKTIKVIRDFIKTYHKEMYKIWIEGGGKPEHYKDR